MRQQENISLTTEREVIAAASPSLKATLGLEHWHGIGHVNGISPLSGTELGLERMSCATPPPLPSTGAEGGGLLHHGAEIGRASSTLSTGDLDQLRSDLDLFGYAVLASAITERAAETLALRVVDQAQAEASAGLGSVAMGRRLVRTLINKGDECVQLLLLDEVNALLQHVIGEEYLLSDASASVPVDSGEDAEEAGMGITQWWMPQPVRAQQTPAMRAGDVSPEQAGSESWAAASDVYIAPPVSATALWCATGSGAIARVVPRSHLSGRSPAAGDSIGEAVEVPLSPGSVLLLDGRTWFAEASGRGVSARLDYGGPQFRTAENLVLATSDAALRTCAALCSPLLSCLCNLSQAPVLCRMPTEAKEQLGFKTWFGCAEICCRSAFDAERLGCAAGTGALAACLQMACVVSSAARPNWAFAGQSKM